MPDDKDFQFMKMALRLARKGRGYVSPNPLVGAILVKGGRVIGRGYHACYGQAHAEVRAITSATESVKGSTLYCNLEPCVHTDKQTPPCAQLLIREGIKKVVIAGLDPNPRVQGKGVTLLQQSGIEVHTGILAAENNELNRFFFKYITRHLPYVTVKIARTIDGIIAPGLPPQSGRAWISSIQSRKLVHRWRTEYDAILVGGNTVRIDDPELSRHGIKGRDPVRIIVDGNLSISPDLRVFHSGAHSRIIIICADNMYNKKKLKKFEALQCTVIPVAGNPAGKISMKSILKILAREKIISILVEGGQQIFSQFIQDQLTDELIIFTAPRIWGQGLPAFTTGLLNPIRNWRLQAVKNIAEDLLLIYRPV